MLETLGQGYAALFAASAQAGAIVIRQSLKESEKLARASADVMRAPKTERQTSLENVLVVAYDAQRQHLQAMRGASAVFGMSFLSHFEASRRHR